MTATNTHYVHITNINKTKFYSLIDFRSVSSKADFKSTINGAKFVTLEVFISGNYSDENKAIIIFPDVYCHAEGLRIFREEFHSVIDNIRAVSAGIIHTNPTHDNEGVTLFGSSLSLQLGYGSKDKEEIEDFYVKMTKHL